MKFSTLHLQDILSYIKISATQEATIKSWWEAFDKDQAEICKYYNGEPTNFSNIVDWMEQHLQVIDNDIIWEFGPRIHKTHRLVITSEDNRPLRPLVQYILSQAPEYPDWEFYEYRVPESLEEASMTMTSRTNWQDIAEITFELTHEEYNTLGINYYLPESLYQEGKLSYPSYVLTESLLGEEIFDKWVSKIEIYQKPKNKVFRNSKDISKSISLLNEEVIKRIANLKSNLPFNSYGELITNQKIL